MTEEQEQIALNLQTPLKLTWFERYIKFPYWRLKNKISKETK